MTTEKGGTVGERRHADTRRHTHIHTDIHTHKILTDKEIFLRNENRKERIKVRQYIHMNKRFMVIRTKGLW